MINNKKFLAITPARAGSKRLPNKLATDKLPNIDVRQLPEYNKAIEKI